MQFQLIGTLESGQTLKICLSYDQPIVKFYLCAEIVMIGLTIFEILR